MIMNNTDIRLVRFSVHPVTLLAFAMLAMVFRVEPVQSQNTPNLIPHTLFHDFETGEQFGWEPYPYQQDIGYDALFFTRQSPTYGESNYALARPVRANDTTELYHGFTRRLNMWTNEQTRLQAQIFLQTDRSPATLEVALGTFGGRLYSHVIESPQTNRWVELDLAVSDFRDEQGRSLQAGEHIQVVKLEAEYPSVYYLFTYTILMDDFQLTGDRQRRFVAEDPISTDLEEFDQSILKRHYYAGETMSLRVNPEGNIALDRVRGRLLDSSGRVVRDNIAFERRDGAWVNDSIRRFQSSDARGQWSIELMGQRSGRADVEWAFDFLVPVQQVSEHPRLFFTRESLAERKAELENHPVASRILENAVNSSRRFLRDAEIENFNEPKDEYYVRHTSEAWTGGPWSGWQQRLLKWRDPMYGLVDIIENGAFLYAFEGDREAGHLAKSALLKLSSFEHWNAHWMIENRKHVYLYMGRISSMVALGYDLLYDLMNESERAQVREALMEKMIKPFYRDMVEINRMPSHNSNHIALLARGAGHAAAVLYGEDPDNPTLEPYLSGILAKFRAYLEHNYGPEGGTGEPFIYQSAATAYAALLMEVLDRSFGVDWSQSTDVNSYYLYPLLSMAHNGRYADYGDARWVYDRFSNNGAQWFAGRQGDPLLYSKVKPYWEAGTGGYFGWLWFRDDLEPVHRETLPTSHFVPKNQIQLMRSGWEDESTIISYKAGPHGNHFHYDQGTFRINTNGADLITDPLIPTGSYYSNLEFVVYNIHAISKNVMLIDYDAESQKPAHYDNGIAALSSWPRTHYNFTGEIADAISSELAPVYKDKLQRYTRTLLYTKHGPLFLFDQVESVSSEGHTYNWLFHAPQEEGFERTIDWQDGRVTVDREAARLAIDVVSPKIASARIRDNNDPNNPESFVMLNSEEGMQKANFLAVLYPEARPSGGRFGEHPATQAVEAPGWLGARVTLGNKTDYGVFRTSGAGTGNLGQSDSDTAASSVAGFTTDATRFMASLDASGSLVRYYVEGSSFEGHGQSMSAGRPVKLAVRHHGSGTDAEVDAAGSTRLSFTVQSRPSRVSLDGSSVRYSYENGRVHLQVPAGRHDIEVR